MASHCLGGWVNELNFKKYQEEKYEAAKFAFFPGTPHSSILAQPMSNVWASPPMPSCPHESFPGGA